MYVFVAKKYDTEINKKTFKHKNLLHYDKILWGEWNENMRQGEKK